MSTDTACSSGGRLRGCPDGQGRLRLMLRPSNETITLSDYLHQVYVPSKLDLSPGTVQQYEIAIRVFERWAGDTLSIRDLDESFLRQFLAVYSQSNAPPTVNKKRQLLLTLWTHAYEEDIADRPPRLRKVPRAREPRRIPEAWTPEEVGRLLAATGRLFREPESSWWRAGLLFLYDTGCRVSEALRMQEGDLDATKRLAVFRQTKTGVDRLRELHPETVEAWLSVHPGSGPPWPYPYSRSWMTVCMSRLCGVARIRYGQGKGGCFQKLRHTSGTLVDANGGEGHTHLGNSRAVFERHYKDPRFFASQLDKLPRPRL